MAQSYTNTDGTFIIPGAYPSIKVENGNSNLSTTGVIALVGEADAGPDFSKETNLNDNSFGPDQAADVVAKYKSGPLVEAFKAAVTASADENITGSFFRAILVKPNVSGKASAKLKKWDGSDYSTLQDRSYGQLGNLISGEVTARASEVVPTTDTFTFLPPISTTNIDLRANGGAAQAVSVTAQMLPTAFVAAVDALTSISASGGTDRNILGTVGSPIAGNLALTVTDVASRTVRVDFSVNFGATAQAGDTLWIRVGSVLAGGSNVNCGSYVVISATANSITARKLIDATGTPNALTNPTNVGSIAAVDYQDIRVFAPVSISITAGNPVDGLGKSLEINELTSGAGLFSYIAYKLNSGVPSVVTWISKVSAPYVITSATEYQPLLAASRQIDSISEELYVGGQVALALGYKGTTASAVIANGELTITLTGGVSASLSPITLKLKDYATVADLAKYLSSIAGFTAAPGVATLGQQPSTSLDAGTYTFGSTHGARTGRIKQDAYRWHQQLKNNGILVEQAAAATAGLPAPQSLFFLSGGSKGGTTDASYAAAIDALETARCNFVVPLFSRDAALDVIDGLTDASSSYTIDGIHAYTKSHVLKMSTVKRKRNRQAFLSFRGSFLDAKTKSSNLAHPRVAFPFQDVKDAPSGTVVQFQGWMSAVKAAGMQAAGFYRPIVRKFINISGALQAAGDFNDQNDSHVEDALLSGLMPIRQAEEGGWYWVSDQTTYGKDNNFVYNSIQAVYIADVVALTTAQRMERAFVGQSVADVGRGLAIATLEAIMDDMLRLKLIAPSDDAPRGFKNVSIKIKGSAMEVFVEIKLAGAIYFIPIQFQVSQVQQG